MPDRDVPRRQSNTGPYLRGQPRHGLARRTLSFAMLAVLLLLLLYPMFGDNGLSAFVRLRSERDRLRREVERLERERESLAAQITELQQNPAALERFAREHYNMALPGETVLRLVPESEVRRQAP
jgi:cell division protein FtsB